MMILEEAGVFVFYMMILEEAGVLCFSFLYDDSGRGWCSVF